MAQILMDIEENRALLANSIPLIRLVALYPVGPVWIFAHPPHGFWFSATILDGKN